MSRIFVGFCQLSYLRGGTGVSGSAVSVCHNEKLYEARSCNLAGVSLRASSKFFLITRHQHQETTTCHCFKPAGLGYGSGLHGTPVCETLHFRCRFSAYQTFWTDDCLRVPISLGQRSKHQPLLSLRC
ncbi:hypothetical protein B0T13DRAFT_477401, partial [Neurospora crassa]